MPVYLFTYHAYRSWMPDHPRGYTKRGVGQFLPDPEMARKYEQRAGQDVTIFDNDIQSRIVSHVRTIPSFIPIQLYAITTEPTHIHVLCGWQADRTWESVRESIKTSITKFLKSLDHTPPLKLSRGASRRHVQKQEHFDFHMFEYLPKHSGVSWFEDRGVVAARREAWEALKKRGRQ